MLGGGRMSKLRREERWRAAGMMEYETRDGFDLWMRNVNNTVDASCGLQKKYMSCGCKVDGHY
jgi:hypothetical protein